MREHRHLGSYGILEKDGKIALVRKSRGAYTGKLDLPGGSFEHGETPVQCVTREILEETALKVKQLDLLDATAVRLQWEDSEHDDVEDLHHIGILYRVTVEESPIKQDGDGQDSLGAFWYEIDSLKREELSPFASYALEKLGYDVR